MSFKLTNSSQLFYVCPLIDDDFRHNIAVNKLKWSGGQGLDEEGIVG